jgi:glycosyltransferase involved in cell wall biosynthesis
LKIIQILNHSPSKKIKFNEVLFDGWHARVAREMLKETKKFSIECWLPCRTILNNVETTLDGIIYKAFPSFHPYSGCEFSPFLVNELMKIKKKEDVITHIHGDRDFLTYSICMLSKNRIIIQHHGSSDERELKFFNVSPLEKVAFRNVNHIFALSPDKQNYLVNKVGVNPDKVSIQTMGVDFNFFKPSNKSLAREKLGLPADKKFILFVGRFDKYPRGLDVVLSAFNQIKNVCPVELLLVGGSSKDSLFLEAKRYTPYVFERQPSNLMPLFYAASDVFAWFCSSKADKYGGIGMSVVEALACGIPVVSTTLSAHYTPDRSDLGELPVSKDNFREQITKVLENSVKYSKCRETAKKYYDWKTITTKTIALYDALL